MGVKLQALLSAATRYERYLSQLKNPTDQDALERLRLGIKNATQFADKSDRLRVVANAVNKLDPQTAATVVPPPLLDPVRAGREALFADNDLRPVRYLQIALLAARAVGKLTVRDFVDEEGDATGFLVAPGLLLTNQHVLRTALYASVSFVSFDYEDDLDGRPKTPKLFDLLPDELYVADEELDYCLVAVSPRTSQGEPLSQFGYLRLFEETGKVDPNRHQAANIIQHPLGQGKKLAIRANYFKEPPKDASDPDRKLNSLFYGTDTLKGSSGSPVCTDEWYVVALHRGGVPKTELVDGQPAIIRTDGTPAREGDSKYSISYLANEGTRVSRIFASLRQKAAAGTVESAFAAAALERIKAVATNPKVGPVDRATAPLVTPSPDAGAEFGGVEEKLVKKSLEFVSGDGYQSNFLGKEVGLPTLSSEAEREAAQLNDGSGYVLDYLHFSVVMNARRRTAFYAACNIDGDQLWKRVHRGTTVGSRPTAWGIDPRIDVDAQPDDSIFSPALQRGHLYKREDAAWGADDDQRKLGDLHSFMITNATPMIKDFNNKEWGDLEDIVSKHVMLGEKVSYFAGPIFTVEDPYFNELKAGVPRAQRRKGMKVPTAFWKIVAWVEDRKLKAAGFILDQTDEIAEHGKITEERLTFGKYEPRPIAEIEAQTGLSFPDLLPADIHA